MKKEVPMAILGGLTFASLAYLYETRRAGQEIFGEGFWPSIVAGGVVSLALQMWAWKIEAE